VGKVELQRILGKCECRGRYETQATKKQTHEEILAEVLKEMAKPIWTSSALEKADEP
jgi:hypothetical protein